MDVGDPLAAYRAARSALQPAIAARGAQRSVPARVPDKHLRGTRADRPERGSGQFPERHWALGDTHRSGDALLCESSDSHLGGCEASEALFLGLQLNRAHVLSRSAQRHARVAEPRPAPQGRFSVVWYSEWQKVKCERRAPEPPDRVHVVRADGVLECICNPQRPLPCLVLSVGREAEVPLSWPPLCRRPRSRRAQVAANPEAPAESDAPVVETRSYWHTQSINHHARYVRERPQPRHKDA